MSRRIRNYLSTIPDIEQCGTVLFWTVEEEPKPMCPFSHAAVARGLVYEKGRGGSVTMSINHGVHQEARMMYAHVWDKAVNGGMPRKEAHELALKAAEAVEDSL